MPQYFAGPGKLVFNGALLMAVQENGQITYNVTQAKLDYAQAMHGRVGSQLGNTTGKISVTPFDNWSALPVLMPTYLGATTATGPGSGAGVLAIGTRPHNMPYGAGADIPAYLWNPAGNGVKVLRAAVTRHPDLHLGIGKALYGAAELTALPSSAWLAAQTGKFLGAFHTAYDSAMADPSLPNGPYFTVADFVREAWVGAWGAVAGFTGIQAEDEWTISNEVRYDEVPVQQQTVFAKLASVQFMAKCRPVNPLWTQIEAQVMNRTLGERWGSPGAQAAPTDLVLTSSGTGRTITLKDADVQGEGFEFGGTRLATGEVGFVTQLVFDGTGNPGPQIIFSA